MDEELVRWHNTHRRLLVLRNRRKHHWSPRYKRMITLSLKRLMQIRSPAAWKRALLPIVIRWALREQVRVIPEKFHNMDRVDSARDTLTRMGNNTKPLARPIDNNVISSLTLNLLTLVVIREKRPSRIIRRNLQKWQCSLNRTIIIVPHWS